MQLEVLHLPVILRKYVKCEYINHALRRKELLEAFAALLHVNTSIYLQPSSRVNGALGQCIHCVFIVPYRMAQLQYYGRKKLTAHIAVKIVKKCVLQYSLDFF